MKSTPGFIKSDRLFALTCGLALLGIDMFIQYFVTGFVFLKFMVMFLGLVLVILPGVMPDILVRPSSPESPWMRFSRVLHQAMTPILLALVYYGCFLPMGLGLKALGKDPLRRKADAGCSSYWIKRDPPGPDPDSIKMQF